MKKFIVYLKSGSQVVMMADEWPQRQTMMGEDWMAFFQNKEVKAVFKETAVEGVKVAG